MAYLRFALTHQAQVMRSWYARKKLRGEQVVQMLTLHKQHVATWEGARGMEQRVAVAMEAIEEAERCEKEPYAKWTALHEAKEHVQPLYDQCEMHQQRALDVQAQLRMLQDANKSDQSLFLQDHTILRVLGQVACSVQLPRKRSESQRASEDSCESDLLKKQARRIIRQVEAQQQLNNQHTICIKRMRHSHSKASSVGRKRARTKP